MPSPPLKRSMTPAMPRRAGSSRPTRRRRPCGNPKSWPSGRVICSSCRIGSFSVRGRSPIRMGPREEFLRHLGTERNLSPHTVRAYGGDLDRFIVFVGGEATLLSPAVDVGLIRKFLSKLHADSYQKTSMARMLACLRTFYDYF